jgi:hypothetical protein
MNEKKKLEEAKYFYSKMLNEQGNREAFTYDLSAFLSAARSVLQYALEESRLKKGGQKWYEKLMVSSRLLKFFKDERDVNIHTGPVLPKAHYTLYAEAGNYILMSGLVSMIVRDKEGNIKQPTKVSANSSEEQEKPVQKSTSMPNEVRYFFNNWMGDEDVLTLSKNYIEEIESAINDGITQGFITGK